MPAPKLGPSVTPVILTPRFSLALTWIGGLLAMPGTACGHQPTDVKAHHRSGQTVITWTEVSEVRGETYRIYRHNVPITTGNLSQATRLYEVAEDSSRLYSNRYRTGGGWRDRYIERCVVEDRQPPLAAGTGMLVWTLAPEDFGGARAGVGHYAVTVVEAGRESTRQIAAGSTAGPVVERVAEPRPVEVDVNIGEGGHLFLQYMDLRQWNPTFHAPRAKNFLGLSGADPAIRGALEYVYDYVVYEPYPGICGGRVPAGPFPILLILHGHGGDRYGPFSSLPEDHWCSYYIYPTDVRQTWFFGFARKHDYRTARQPSSRIGLDETVVNYTEQRVLRMLYDLERDPRHGPRIDANRRYISGHSMGGGGALALGMRYPNLFAAIYASQPPTNLRTAGDGGGDEWRRDAAAKWGLPSQNLPTEINGPGGWAEHLRRYNGTGVWDWHDHQANFDRRMGDEMAPMGLSHGYRDNAVEWTTQGRPIYAILDRARRPWGGRVTDKKHRWAGFRGLPPAIKANRSSTPFDGMKALLAETVPGLSGASGHELPLPPQPPKTLRSRTRPEVYPAVGGYNRHLDWSASWRDWDGAPIDEPLRWQMSLRTTNRSTQTVDVTPRRTQRFCVLPGRSYTWENRKAGGGSVVARGTTKTDAHGLLTVKGVTVTPSGNQLRITGRAGEGTPAKTELRLTTVHRGPNAVAGVQFEIAVSVGVLAPGRAGGVGVELAAADAEIVSAVSSAGYCRVSRGAASCKLGSLTSELARRVNLTLRAPKPATATLRATAKGFDCDAKRIRQSWTHQIVVAGAQRAAG